MSDEPTGTRIHGRPRSLAEMDFVAGLYPCTACGERVPVITKTGGSGSVWNLHVRCGRCSAPRMFVFSTDADVTEADHPDLELGGPEPSDILDPYQLIAEIDRLAPLVSARGGDDRARNWDRLERVQTALRELAKFVPTGAADIPATALRTDAAAADRRARPERYTRAWSEHEVAHWDGVARQLVAERGTPPEMPPKRGVLDRKTAEAHWRWVQRGRQGEGGLDVVGFDASGARLDGEKLNGARLSHVRFPKANVSYTVFEDAVLTDCDFTQAQLSSSSLVAASIERCTFESAQCALLDLTKARARDSAFDSAALDKTRWNEATVERSTFRRATFGNAKLEGARFTDCDFRETTYRPISKLPAITLAGAVFERCDFRDADFTDLVLTGATFKSCKLGGVHGKPAATDGLTVIDADFSEAGDGSDPGGLADLLDELR